jgi:hypothetical protein
MECLIYFENFDELMGYRLKFAALSGKFRRKPWESQDLEI